METTKTENKNEVICREVSRAGDAQRGRCAGDAVDGWCSHCCGCGGGGCGGGSG